MSTEYVHIDVEDIEGVTVFRLRGSNFFDRQVILEAQDEMVAYVREHEPERLLIDFGRVRSFSSEAINAILRVREYVIANESQLKLCDMSDSIRQAYKVTNLDGVLFEIHGSMRDALDSF